MQVNNITLLEYFKLENTSEYDVFIDVLKPINSFAGNSFNVSKMTFNEFQTIIHIFNNPSVNNIKKLFLHLYKIRGTFKESSDSIFFKQSVFDFFKAKRFVSDMVKEKLEIESKLLYSEPDTRFIEIGGNEILKPFSSMLTKISLGKQFGVDPYVVGDWEYSKVITILATNNALNNVEKRYNAK
jgi:hypothetical protein